MKIVITGAAGFVGSNLSSALIQQGHAVIGIDNFSYGSKQNIVSLQNNPKFIMHEQDLCNPDTLADIKGDVIVHLASQKIPRYTNALKTLDDNSRMLKNVIQKCLKDKIKLCFSSTSDVYGKNPEIPYTEESNLLLGPTTVKRWAYALSKIYAEHFIIANNEEYGMDYTIMRFFGSYGPNQNTTWWGGPQSVFIQSIIDGIPLEIHGDGLQTRTFTYVDDTVQGIIKCILKEEAKNQIFNIANNPEEEITILDLASLIWKLMKGQENKPDVKFIPYETFGKYEDVRRRVPSIEKIKTILGFKPSFSLADGLAKTIEWQKQKNQAV